LKSRGVGCIIASGRRPLRLKLAKEAGADIVNDAAVSDVYPAVMKATARKGADLVFECAGNESSFNQALQIPHRGGKINLVGLFEQPIHWNPSIIAGNDLTLIGCGLRWDLPGAVKLLQQGIVKAKPLITHHFPLERLQEAFLAQQNDPNAIKVMVDIC
jgi:threonine dehydrogenase-like Zn-dependent dehydrogenase